MGSVQTVREQAVHLPRSFFGFKKPAGKPIEKGPDEFGSTPNSRGFAALLAAFRSTGGTLRGDEFAQLFADRGHDDIAALARRLVAGEIFSFEWHNTSWVPMFQFDYPTLAVKPGARHVLLELAGVFDGWMLAAWLAQPNSWLTGARPVELLASNQKAVLAAAQADRTIALG
ncbi:MAG: hypothetical protein V4772_22700 [Pseudomonadota bacterium]